jgi:hypothetical protein
VFYYAEIETNNLMCNFPSVYVMFSIVDQFLNYGSTCLSGRERSCYKRETIKPKHVQRILTRWKMQKREDNRKYIRPTAERLQCTCVEYECVTYNLGQALVRCILCNVVIFYK